MNEYSSKFGKYERHVAGANEWHTKRTCAQEPRRTFTPNWKFWNEKGVKSCEGLGVKARTQPRESQRNYCNWNAIFPLFRGGSEPLVGRALIFCHFYTRASRALKPSRKIEAGGRIRIIQWAEETEEDPVFQAATAALREESSETRIQWMFEGIGMHC